MNSTFKEYLKEQSQWKVTQLGDLTSVFSFIKGKDSGLSGSFPATPKNISEFQKGMSQLGFRMNREPDNIEFTSRNNPTVRVLFDEAMTNATVYIEKR